MQDQIGQIVRNKQEKTMGHIVELQVRRVRDGYRSEWSLDGGNNWNSLLTVVSDPDMALLKAGSGAFLAIIHQNVKRRRQADG